MQRESAATAGCVSEEIENKQDETRRTDATKEDSNDRKDDRKELSERQDDILSLIYKNDRITIDEMTEKIGVSEKTIRRDLEVLQSKGILSREGGRKEGRWVIKNGN